MKDKYENLDRLNEIKILLKQGKISYDEAKKQAEPIIKKMNETISQVSAIHKMKPKFIHFTGFMR